MSELEVAQIGKVVGLKGDLKLHSHSDFPEQFHVGATFYTASGSPLRICAFNAQTFHVRFASYEERERASTLTNTFLYTTIEATKQTCTLSEGEYFWFDIVGCKVVENGEVLGVVEEIERIGTQDYFVLNTAPHLVEQGLCATFLIPYGDRYVLHVNVDSKEIISKDARELLESL
ncbi:MAG: 16S rRNA processing protein RimM [Campylobacterales bacterium]|nr:16S rRNA processing protein RimM [Campylobacterales bacterium]